MNKKRIRQVVLVEGRYDATALASMVDGLIITTDGFSIFANKEKQALIRRLGKQRGLLILTDSDAAGFKIRYYIEKFATGCNILHAYIPALPGKESRKRQASKEGTLGVEGVPAEVLWKALEDAGAFLEEPPRPENQITYTDLFEMGLSGSSGSAERRRTLLKYLGLPARLSKRTLVQVLSSLYTREELSWYLNRKPVLFWDFHGTLTLPDTVWQDAAMEAAEETVPQRQVSRQRMDGELHGRCLPWFCIKDGDTRHLLQPGAWWGFCEGQFAAMYQRCGYTVQEAAAIAPVVRSKVLEKERYQLRHDAVETLSQLQKRGYRSYILSNNFPELSDIVTHLGLTPFLDGVLVSGRLGYDKPNINIFEAARKVAGPGAELWMIGDNPVDDIEGAANAGFITVEVGAKSRKADYAVQQLDDLLELLP